MVELKLSPCVVASDVTQHIPHVPVTMLVYTILPVLPLDKYLACPTM